MIEGMVERIEKEFGASMNVVATGGLAPLFLNASDRISHAVGIGNPEGYPTDHSCICELALVLGFSNKEIASVIISDW